MSTAPPVKAVETVPGVSRKSLRQTARQGAYLWAANLAVTGLGLVTPLVLTRFASPDDYGRFSFVAATLAVVNIVTLPGINIIITQAVARGQYGILTAGVRTRMRWAMLGCIVVALLGTYMLMFRDLQTGYLLLVLAPLFPLVYGLDVAQAFINGAQRFVALSAWMLIAAAVPSLAVITTLWLGASIVIVTVCYFATLAAVNAFSYWWVRLHFQTDGYCDLEAIGYGKRLSLITSLGAAQFYLDKIIIGAALGFYQLGIYSVAKLFQQGVKATWAALNQIYFPKLSSRNTTAARHLTRSTLLYVCGGFALLTLGLIVVIPAIVRLLFGSNYVASIPIAQALVVAIWLGIPGAQFEILFRAVGDERRLYTQRIIFAIVEIGLIALGALWFGVWGVVAASLIASLTNSVVGFSLDYRR